MKRSIIYWIFLDANYRLKEIYKSRVPILQKKNVTIGFYGKTDKQKYREYVRDQRRRTLEYKKYIVETLDHTKFKFNKNDLCYKDILIIERRLNCLLFNSVYVLEKISKSINDIHQKEYVRDLKIEEILK
jgi:hypothetical protein